MNFILCYQVKQLFLSTWSHIDNQAKKSLAKKFNTLFFYSNHYLHCIGENIFETVCVVSEKSGK